MYVTINNRAYRLSARSCSKKVKFVSSTSYPRDAKTQNNFALTNFNIVLCWPSPSARKSRHDAPGSPAACSGLMLTNGLARPWRVSSFHTAQMAPSGCVCAAGAAMTLAGATPEGFYPATQPHNCQPVLSQEEKRTRLWIEALG